MTENLLHI